MQGSFLLSIHKMNYPLLFLHNHSHGFVLSLAHLVWPGWGGAGDMNRQVLRCVMFDILTQHAFITYRRCVWQQRLPDHDYIISWCAAEGQGTGVAPVRKTRFLRKAELKQTLNKILNKSISMCCISLFTVNSDWEAGGYCLCLETKPIHAEICS